MDLQILLPPTSQHTAATESRTANACLVLPPMTFRESSRDSMQMKYLRGQPCVAHQPRETRRDGPWQIPIGKDQALARHKPVPEEVDSKQAADAAGRILTPFRANLDSFQGERRGGAGVWRRRRRRGETGACRSCPPHLFLSPILPADRPGSTHMSRPIQVPRAKSFPARWIQSSDDQGSASPEAFSPSNAKPGPPAFCPAAAVAPAP
jgi:hypothetical protein